MTMAFEDDMIDAGFNDAEDYLEYLMDDGDRRMQRLIDEEDRWHYDENYESWEE